MKRVAVVAVLVLSVLAGCSGGGKVATGTAEAPTTQPQTVKAWLGKDGRAAAAAYMTQVRKNIDTFASAVGPGTIEDRAADLRTVRQGLPDLVAAAHRLKVAIDTTGEPPAGLRVDVGVLSDGLRVDVGVLSDDLGKLADYDASSLDGCAVAQDCQQAVNELASDLKAVSDDLKTADLLNT